MGGLTKYLKECWRNKRSKLITNLKKWWKMPNSKETFKEEKTGRNLLWKKYWSNIDPWLKLENFEKGLDSNE